MYNFEHMENIDYQTPEKIETMGGKRDRNTEDNYL